MLRLGIAEHDVAKAMDEKENTPGTNRPETLSTRHRNQHENDDERDGEEDVEPEDGVKGAVALVVTMASTGRGHIDQLQEGRGRAYCRSIPVTQIMS